MTSGRYKRDGKDSACPCEYGTNLTDREACINYKRCEFEDLACSDFYKFVMDGEVRFSNREATKAWYGIVFKSVKYQPSGCKEFDDGKEKEEEEKEIS